MSWTKRNVRGTRRTRRKLMKIWTGTECERGSAKRRRRTNNFFIMNYSRPIGGRAQNQNSKKNKRPLLFHCFFLSVFFPSVLRTLFTKREVDKSSSLVNLKYIFIILFFYPFFFYFAHFLFLLLFFLLLWYFWQFYFSILSINSIPHLWNITYIYWNSLIVVETIVWKSFQFNGADWLTQQSHI